MEENKKVLIAKKFIAFLIVMFLILQMILPDISYVIALDDTGNESLGSEEITGETDGTEETSQEPYDLNLSNFNLWVKAQKLDADADATQVTVKDGDEIEITFNWSITNNVQDSNGQKQLVYSYELDTPGITLNDLYNDDEDTNAVYSDDIRIGYYTIVENVFTIYLDSETTENKSDISGGAILEGVVSLDADDKLYDNSEQILGVVDKTYNVTYDSGSTAGTVDIKKSTVGDIVETQEGFYTQQYQVVINITGKITNISMEDVLPAGLEYVEDTLTADEGLTAEYDNGTISVAIPDSETKSGSYTYTITYTAKITSDAILSGENISNTATVKYTDSAKTDQEGTSTATITPPTTGGTEDDPVVGYATVAKEAVDEIAYHKADDEDTESYYYQDYKITVEVVGKATDVSLSDELPDTLTLIESSLTLETESTTTVDNDDATLTFESPYIKATFLDGVEDEKTTYTITYRAKVDTDVVKNLEDIVNTATLTYKDPDGNTSIKTSEVTVTPISISIYKTGSYAGVGTYAGGYLCAFDWAVTIDFGTLGLSLTDDEINEILATITDTAFCNDDESLAITPDSPYGGENSPYLNSNGYSDNAVKLFFNGGNITVDDLVNNEDGTYSLYYSVSYYLAQYGIWGTTITSITNVITIDEIYTSHAKVCNEDGTINFNKSSSFDPYDVSNYNSSVSFTTQDIIRYEQESEVLYNEDDDYYYKEYTINIIVPTNTLVSNIVVSCDFDDNLNYVPGSTTVIQNGTNVDVQEIDYRYSSQYFPKTNTECYVSYDYLYLSDLNFIDIELFGETNSTYTISYRTKILEYDDENNYEDLENTIEYDYDLEAPYDITLDLSNISESLQTQFLTKVTSFTISDSLYDGGKGSYYIDWDESQSYTINTGDIRQIANNGSWHTDSKYDDIREFLKNFTVTMGDTTYKLSDGSLVDFFGYSWNATLTISRYEWTFTVNYSSSTNYGVYNFIKQCFSNGSVIKINYNAVQDSESYGSINLKNKATYSITVADEELTGEDYVNLNTNNVKFFAPSKSSLDSLTLGEDTYEYTKDNNIGWVIKYYGYGELCKGDTITFTDTLPDNVSYVDGEYVAYFSDSGSNSLTNYEIFSDEYGTLNVDYDENENIVTFTINIKATYAPYIWFSIYFKTEIDEEYYESMQANGSKYSLVNKVTLDKNGTTKTASATKTINTTEDTTITKDSTIDIDYETSNITADFTITANPNSKNYVSDEGDLTITDTMPSSFVLDETSVKAINANTEEEIEIVTEYDDENNKIYFSIPDETYVKITYSVKIDVDILENPFWYKDTTNTATITNGRYSGNSASSTAAEEQSFEKVWATLDTGSVSIHKYWNNEGTETSLSGATFTLYSIYDNMEHTETEEIANITVDEDGNATLTDLPLDRIYKLVETGVPDGYVQADDYYFILEGNDGVTVPESLYGYSISTIEIGSTIYVENYKSTTVEVSKTWSGDSNYLETYRPESVTITLYRTISDSKEKEIVGEYEVTAEKDWKLTIDNLREYDDDGNTYIYSIEEKDVAGYSSEITEVKETTESGEQTETGNSTEVEYTGNFAITNTFEFTSISGTKTWIGDDTEERPENIEIVLYAGGEKYTNEYKITWSNTDTDVWSYTIGNLPMYSTNGEKIVYTVVEENVENYTTTYSEDTLNITNTRIVKEDPAEEPEEEDPTEEEPTKEENQTSGGNSSSEESKVYSSSKTDDSSSTTTVYSPKTNDEIIVFVIIGIVAVTVLVLNILYNKLTDAKDEEKKDKK